MCHPVFWLDIWREENSSTLVDAWRNDLTRSKAAAVLGNSVANMPSNIRTHDLLAAFLVRCKVVPGEEEGLDWYRPYAESLPGAQFNREKNLA